MGFNIFGNKTSLKKKRKRKLDEVSSQSLCHIALAANLTLLCCWQNHAFLSETSEVQQHLDL